MLSLRSIDVTLGLVLVYLWLGLMCTAFNEIVAGVLALRAKTLRGGIEKLLSDRGPYEWCSRFYSHPLVRSLSREKRMPSYISSHIFGRVLLDLAREGAGGIDMVSGGGASGFTREEAKAEGAASDGGASGFIDDLPRDSDVGDILRSLQAEAGGDPERLRKEIESWFEEATDRIAGWYKRRIQTVTVVAAVAIVTVLNVDTIQIARAFARDPHPRAAALESARVLVDRPPAVIVPLTGESSGAAGETAGQAFGELRELGVPLGWRTVPRDWAEWGLKIMGLLLTALAASLGAPFWFDLLKRFVNIRSVGGRP